MEHLFQKKSANIEWCQRALLYKPKRVLILFMTVPINACGNKAHYFKNATFIMLWVLVEHLCCAMSFSRPFPKIFKGIIVRYFSSP